MATTIYDVAKAAGVSPATVSRVFNRRPNVSAEVRGSVLEVAQNLGYSPQQSAVRDCYAIVLEPDNNPGLTGYQELLLRALNRQAYASGHRIELVGLADMPTANSRSYHGVIGTVYKPDHVRRFIKTARALNAPAVLINSRARGVSTVCTDERAGMKTALGTLAGHGHRSVLHVGHHSAAWCSSTRVEALDTLAPTFDMRVAHIDVGGQDLLERLTDALDPSNTAVLVTGEGLGHRVLHYLRKLRLEPGRDIAVVAHEMPGVSEFCAPPLTTIEQDFAALTETALNLLNRSRDPVGVPDAGRGHRANRGGAEKHLVAYRFHDRESVPQIGQLVEARTRAQQRAQAQTHAQPGA